MAEKIDTPNEKEMNIVGHLAELRNRLLFTAIFFVVFFIGIFIFVEEIYYFIAQDIPFDLNITSPGDIIWVYFTFAGLGSLIVTLPILCLQLWLFIKPGLTKSERRLSILYVPAVFILFILGIVFGYFMFTNLILPFLLSLNNGMFNEIFTVEKYFRFLFRVLIPFALLFEIPVIIMFLTSIGILTPKFMRKTRKYAYFILLIIAALITPPDVVLQIVVAVPLFILYEISILLAERVYKKRQSKQQS